MENLQENDLGFILDPQKCGQLPDLETKKSAKAKSKNKKSPNSAQNETSKQNAPDQSHATAAYRKNNAQVCGWQYDMRAFQGLRRVLL